jgi:hypothetical protein
MNYVIEKLAFEGPKTPDRGYTMSAHYLNEPKGDALILIFKDGVQVREFLYPAYKIYNLQAHFREIVDSEISRTTDGYEIAGSTGFGGCVMPQPTRPTDSVTEGNDK